MLQVAFTPAEIVAIAQPLRTAGATGQTIRGVAALGGAEPGDVSFLGNARYRAAVPASRASVVLLPADYAGGPPQPDQLYLFVENPSLVLARLCARIEQALWPKPAPGIHPLASVAPGAQVAASATIGPFCVVEADAFVGERVHLQAQVFVGREARVGDDCWLMPGAVVAAACTLGRRVRLQPGVIIGSDGYGYEFAGGRYEKTPQVGTVVIGDDVEIGANSTVDRARFDRTEVGEGTKIDNLAQVGHNVIIGKHCLICAQVGLGGSCVIEDYVIVGGQSGLAGHLTVGRAAKIAAQSGVKDDIPAQTSVWGSPSLPILLEQKLTILRTRLPELFKRVSALEAQVRDSGA
jgi:UDP-3-O-[3-hydroxymyristoyl] glucosamine N-acyltransferase